MANMQFDLVSPERKLVSVEATEVQIPGAEGDMTVMADHMPIITTLRPGVLRVAAVGGAREYVVTGGFAEITSSGVSVLAEQALPRDEVSAEFLADLKKDAEEAHAAADARTVDGAAKLVADIAAVTEAVGVQAR